MKVLIIEDENVACAHLQKMLQEVDPSIEVVERLDSIESSVACFEKRPAIDLVFLDIELGDGQSFDIFKQTAVDLPIIFTTAYQEHALKAFKLNSVDYLLKPVDKIELSAALDKFRRLHADQKSGVRSNILSLIRQMERVKMRYLAKNGTRLISVAAEEIAYFYTKERLQYIKTFRNEDLVLDKWLDDVELQVDPQKFFRVNRQFILNYDSIKRIHSWFSGKLKVSVEPESYEEIIVSRLKAADFKKWLGE